jgi:hypothetical protein
MSAGDTARVLGGASVKAAIGTADVRCTTTAACTSRNEATKRKENTMAQTIDDVVQAEQPKLFYVRSTENVNGFCDVPVTWFATRCAGGIEMPWAMLIEHYNPHATDCRYVHDALRELFTEAEAAAVVEHLRRIGDGAGTPAMESVQLPVPNWLIPRSDNYFDGDVTFPLADTGLPFPVRGHCKLKGRLLIREEKIGGFVIYWNGRPICKPFADRAAAEAWQRHVLPLRDQYQWPA